MARHNPTSWLSLCSQGKDTDLLVSDRMQAILDYIPRPDTQQPSLVVLIGHVAKAIALREVFGVRRIRHLSLKRNPTEVHLHVHPLSVFGDHPLVIVDGGLSHHSEGSLSADRGHGITRRAIRRSREEFGSGGPASGIYTQLLFPFVNVFCYFCDDLGGFTYVASHLATWLEDGYPATGPATTRPRVVVVTEKIPVGTESERRARKALLALIRKKTASNLHDRIPEIEVIALFADNELSAEARHRPLKERILTSSNEVQRQRQKTHSLFSATHLVALLESACEHFSNTLGEPFNVIKSCRAHNPLAVDLGEHLSAFLAHIRSPTDLTTFAAPIIASSFFLDNYPPGAHYFAPEDIFNSLYKDSLTTASRSKVMTFKESNHGVIQKSFLNVVLKHLKSYIQLSIQGEDAPAEIHLENLSHYKRQWLNIHSSIVCLVCLRRKPSYELSCGHMICGNCVRIFGEDCKDDPCLLIIKHCFLCRAAMPEDVYIRIHPSTAGVGILCIDGGGVRGTMPLQILKRITNRIDLPIPLQRFIKVAFGISSGGLIVADMFINGSSIEDSSGKFEALARSVFRRRNIANIPSLPKFLTSFIPLLTSSLHPIPSLLYLAEMIISYFADGLYPSSNIEDALKRVFSPDKSILGISNATATGTLVGLPAATVGQKPECYVFTNYSSGDKKGRHNNYATEQTGAVQRLRLWEIARAISAAPGVFPPKHIRGVGMLQDAGPLENDPLISALTTTATVFPLLEEPDFIVSLGTGEPKPSGDFSVSSSRNVLKNGALPRLCRLFFEKMRDKKLRQAFQTHPRYHRLNVQLDGDEPRLDDVHSMPELRRKAEEDESLSQKIDRIAHCFVASLFYFELDSRPRQVDGKYLATGHILCSISHKDPAFLPLLDRLSLSSAHFWIDGWPEIPVVGNDSFDKDGNFRKRVELNTGNRFAVTLKQNASEPWNISGSPFSVDRLVQQQGFKAVFGRSDHRNKRTAGRLCNPKRKQRRVTQGQRTQN